MALCSVVRLTPSARALLWSKPQIWAEGLIVPWCHWLSALLDVSQHVSFETYWHLDMSLHLPLLFSWQWSTFPSNQIKIHPKRLDSQFIYNQHQFKSSTINTTMVNKYLDWHYNESVLLYHLFMFYILILVKVLVILICFLTFLVILGL